jgi:hypothetical protein
VQPGPPAADLPAVPPTVDDSIARALHVLTALAELGEDVDDEWQYVQDLLAAWSARLEEVAAKRGAETVSAAVGGAVVAAVDEAGRIVDPHRAIDWLSTLPQVVLVALGERP